MVCACVWQYESIARTDVKPYNSLLIAPSCICTLAIERYLTLNIGLSMKGAINRGSYTSAHVLFNLLNELGKRDKMRGLPSILSLFRNEFNKFNNTRARLSYDIKITSKSHF